MEEQPAGLREPLQERQHGDDLERFCVAGLEVVSERSESSRGLGVDGRWRDRR
jgi:hypothetical protein